MTRSMHSAWKERCSKSSRITFPHIFSTICNYGQTTITAIATTTRAQEIIQGFTDSEWHWASHRTVSWIQDHIVYLRIQLFT